MKKKILLIFLLLPLISISTVYAAPSEMVTDATIEVIEGESSWQVYTDNTLTTPLPANMSLGQIGKGQIKDFKFWLSNNGTRYANILISVEGAIGWASFEVFPSENITLLAPTISCPVTVRITSRIDAGQGIKNISIKFREIP